MKVLGTKQISSSVKIKSGRHVLWAINGNYLRFILRHSCWSDEFGRVVAKKAERRQTEIHVDGRWMWLMCVFIVLLHVQKKGPQGRFLYTLIMLTFMPSLKSMPHCVTSLLQGPFPGNFRRRRFGIAAFCIQYHQAYQSVASTLPVPIHSDCIACKVWFESNITRCKCVCCYCANLCNPE